MRKLWKQVLLCLVLTGSVWCGRLLADREMLNRELIRLHVVANSDTEQDQAIKRKVRDSVIDAISQDLQSVRDMDQARAYLQENLPKIQRIANQTLECAGFDGQAMATLCREAFDTRHYETFSLPAGVYEALRITIGEGQGKNWWCVAYPSLCLPATRKDFQQVAVGAGFSDTLSSTLAGEEPVRIRFFLLDCLGRIENNFFQE